MQFGDGTTSRDYTYVSDIVDGVIRALDRPAGYQIYNLGNGSPVQLSSFIKLVEESVGIPAKIRMYPKQPGDVPRTCANVTKAREMLGYAPKVSLADGIRTTVAWYRDRAGLTSTAHASSAATAAATPVINGPNALFRRFTGSKNGANADYFSVVLLLCCVFLCVCLPRARRLHRARKQDRPGTLSVLRQPEPPSPDNGIL